MSVEDDLERDRARIRASLEAVTPPPGADDVVLTRWAVVSEHVAGDGQRYTRVDSGDHDDLELAAWDSMGLLGYGLEKAKQDAWESDGGYHEALGEDDEADG